MGKEFSSESHGVIFEPPRKRIMRQFNTNVLNRFIRYMKLTHRLSVGKYSDEKESEIDKDIDAGEEALIRVGKSSFWV